MVLLELSNSLIDLIDILLRFLVALWETLRLSTKLCPQLHADFFTFTLVPHSGQTLVRFADCPTVPILSGQYRFERFSPESRLDLSRDNECPTIS